ncbi:hypothetical protein LMG18101_00906 [Ralstonia flaminis]|uniref:Uncharacterized protein n=1 Tax=Ralstonia flaminis TaxID=3058597 RepID=A0ABM9K227_9RALS|nr:hypothetical protein LMG18101_00906 [Ralstonia sp. LMG 18101]
MVGNVGLNDACATERSGYIHASVVIVAVKRK